MVGALISDVKADPKVQRVLPVTIQEDSATSGYNKIWNEPTTDAVEPGAESCGLQTACISDSGSRALKWIAVESLAGCNRRRGFELDPLVWGRLPNHLLGLVFARLPLPEMSLVPCLSKARLATSKTPSLRGLCAAGQYNSELVGIESLHCELTEFWLTAFDVNTRKWHYHELDMDAKSLGIDYRLSNFLFAHDGWLVRFVSEYDQSMVICNPLTNLWKKVPLLDHGEKVPIFVVQLVRNAETSCYRVDVSLARS